jgi:hypothetical protein
MAVGSSRACHNGCLCLGAMVLHGLTERELPYTQPCAHRRLTAACGWMDRASRLCAQAAERSCRSPQPGQGVRAHWAASGVRAVSRQDRPHGLPQASHQARAVRHTPPSVTSSRSSTDCAHAHELASALHPRRAALWVRGWVGACVCVGGWVGGKYVLLTVVPAGCGAPIRLDVDAAKVAHEVDALYDRFDTGGTCTRTAPHTALAKGHSSGVGPSRCLRPRVRMDHTVTRCVCYVCAIPGSLLQAAA